MKAFPSKVPSSLCPAILPSAGLESKPLPRVSALCLHRPDQHQAGSACVPSSSPLSGGSAWPWSRQLLEPQGGLARILGQANARKQERSKRNKDKGERILCFGFLTRACLMNPSGFCVLAGALPPSQSIVPKARLTGRYLPYITGTSLCNHPSSLCWTLSPSDLQGTNL